MYKVRTLSGGQLSFLLLEVFFSSDILVGAGILLGKVFNFPP